MGKKLTLEFCKDYAEERGYILNENVYINNSKKMKFIHGACSGYFLMTWNDFFDGHRCTICSNNMKGSAQRQNIDFCKKEAKKKGYKINQDFYSNNKDYMSFTHTTNECGFCFQMTWNAFYNHNHSCPKCARESSANSRKFDINFCKEEAGKRDYIVDQDFYTNNSSPMKFIHSVNNCGFRFSMKWNNFYNQGQCCPKCASQNAESKIAKSLKTYFSDNYNASIEFKECVNPKTNRYLPYDICFDTKYSRVYIEVQGHQHYEFDNYYNSSIESFKYSQYKDKVKKRHAKNNGIFIEVDLRKIKTTESAISYIETLLR